jgi:hypothetical protein
MNDRINPEDLASLLDDRLPQNERAELLTRLSESDRRTLAAYADAAAIADELNLIPHSVDRSLSSRRVRSAWMASGLAAAAVIVVVALSRTGILARDAGSPAQFAQSLTGVNIPPPVEWSATRSANQPLSARVRAVRIGAWISDLALLSAGDSRAPAVASEIATLLDGISGAGGVAAEYRKLADLPKASADVFDRAASSAATVAGRDDVRLGSWLEAARAAALSRRSDFFHSAEARRALDTLVARSTIPEMNRVAADLKTGLAATTVDWTAVSVKLDRLLLEFGN